MEKCDSPPSIANGALTLPPLNQYDNGSSVQYSCSEYYFLQGSERIYCSEGQWTSPPLCIGTHKKIRKIHKHLFPVVRWLSIYRLMLSIYRLSVANWNVIKISLDCILELERNVCFNRRKYNLVWPFY